MNALENELSLPLSVSIGCHFVYFAPNCVILIQYLPTACETTWLRVNSVRISLKAVSLHKNQVQLVTIMLIHDTVSQYKPLNHIISDHILADI